MKLKETTSMKNPKTLAVEAICQSLEELGADVDDHLRNLVIDLVDEQWSARNRERAVGRDEAPIMRLVSEYVARTVR
jgi:hypothetical protein